MSSSPNRVALPLTLHISAEAKERLLQQSGPDVDRYVSELVENATIPPTLEAIAGPIYQRFLESGLTDEQLGDALEQEKHAARAQRRAQSPQ